MLPKKVDRHGGIEPSVVDTVLGVCCVLVEVGLVSKRECSDGTSRLRRMYHLRLSGRLDLREVHPNY